MEINLNNLKNEIINIPLNYPVFIYIGIGAAAQGGADRELTRTNYQQFPPFVQDLRNQIPDLHIILLLIDPYHENPPRVATDYSLIANEDGGQESEQYCSHDKRLQAFVYRKVVYTDADLQQPDHGFNITPLLQDLHVFVKERHVSLLYHDFTGRKTALTSEYFDRENREYLDQIVYGLSAREEHGCHFDLCEPHAYFPFRLDKLDNNSRPIVKMYNYYKYIVNQTYLSSDIELQMYPIKMQSLSEIQKKQIIEIRSAQFKMIYLSILRQVKKYMLDYEDGLDGMDGLVARAAQQESPDLVAKYLFYDLNKFYKEMFTDLFKEKEYKLLYELIFNYTASELDVLAKIKEMDMTGDELLTFITSDKDPYKWYDAVKGLL